MRKSGRKNPSGARNGDKRAGGKQARATRPQKTPGTAKRGRPRSAAARKKILAAAAAMLNEGGLSAVTMEGIAARAGVGKPTIYREWPNAQAVAMAAFLETVKLPGSEQQKVGAQHKGSAVQTLRLHLARVAQVFSTSTGRHTAMMIAAAQNDSELAKVFRTGFIINRREEGRAILTWAIATREVRADIDVEVALDLIYSPLYFRLLVSQGSLDADYTDAVVDMVMKGFG